MIDNAIYTKVKDIHAVDLLGAPRKWTSQVTNATELLFDAEKERMTRSFLNGDIKRYEAMSDYERFSLFVENLHNMSGSGVKELFETEIEMLFSDTAKDAQSLWNAAADGLSLCGYDARRFISERGVIQLDVHGIYEIILKRRYAKSYLDYIDEIGFELAAAPFDTAYYDMSTLDFVKTDVFHCEEAYKRYAACRDYDKTQIDTLSCGMLYSVCEKLKKEQRALWLFVGHNIECAEKLISYFSGRGVLPRVYVVLSESSAKNGTARICRFDNVSPAIAYEMGDTAERIKNKLLELASVYPVSLVRYGGIFGNVAIPEAAHEIVKKGICMALDKICCDTDADEIFNKIYQNHSNSF